jgi:hypothetical protein
MECILCLLKSVPHRGQSFHFLPEKLFFSLPLLMTFDTGSSYKSADSHSEKAGVGGSIPSLATI